ncbi:hypothetical protein [Aeromonas veronii]|uniref:hypothetical protein n=1 Tax=Aeromonas veronii TaxID=654 RepID=UPI00188265F5|nr:hypothetical protein [Aeromonas veronii]MBE8733901.1 hypothetical protein [Aeromonas veronii]MBE8738292.1 hypothetical protein [Aeromonas veronii]MBE8741887.1 hypothetical protein [Aeromonas veronii]MBE8763237.1 hypothetical protein [Aeromonas veronii]MBE8837849.1 hypothetical protein [Aeromonas veronii]
MPVPNKPFLLSEANNEFKANQWGSNILTIAQLAVPGWLGELAGKSAFVKTHTVVIGRFELGGFKQYIAMTSGAFESSISPATLNNMKLDRISADTISPNSFYIMFNVNFESGRKMTFQMEGGEVYTGKVPGAPGSQSNNFIFDVSNALAIFESIWRKTTNVRMVFL